MMKQHVLVNTSLVLALICLIGFVCVIVSCLNKGFELSDESYYLLSTKYPLDTVLLNSSFGLINHRLAFGCSDLFSLRLFKLMYQLLFLGIFARAFFLYAIRNVNAKRNNVLLLSVLIIITGLSNYDYLPMTLSYNSWSLNFGLLFWSGLLFAHIIESKRGVAFSNLLMGLSVLFLFYTKAPNALMMGFVFILYGFLFQRKNLLNAFLLFGLGKIAGIIILFLSVEDFRNATVNLYQTILNTNHAEVGSYFGQISEMISSGLGIRFFLLQGALLAFMYFVRRLNFNPIIGLLLIILNTYFTWNYLKGNSYDVSNEFKVFAVFAFNCFATIILFFTGKHDLKSALIPILLILTPFMLAAGTSNSIFYTSSQLFVLSIAGLFLLLLRINKSEMELYYVYSFAFITFFVGSFLYNGMIKTPYRQTNLSEKSTIISESRQIKNILENNERAAKYKELSDKLKLHNSQNLDVLSSPPALGGLILTDMKPFAVCWIADPDEMAEANEEYFKKVNFNSAKPFLVISRKILNGEKQNKIFRNAGMDLKKDYTIKDSIYLELNKEYYFFMKPILMLDAST
ncbi:MAG: hypothetical protein SGJ15_08260 [Bacteroidota bacterium]|nr:hypothetical protein [Bacteroidota bacterium]